METEENTGDISKDNQEIGIQKDNQNRKTSNAIAYGVSITAVIIVLSVLILSSGQSSASVSATGNTINDGAAANNNAFTNSGGSASGSGEVQAVKLSVQGSNYVFTPSNVTEGIPVRIEADLANLPGCSKSIVMPAFGIRTSFSSSNTAVEFTPDKSGTFNIACSMNMYTGKLIVLEADGSKSAYAEQAAPKSGGCGCGGSRGSCGG